MKKNNFFKQIVDSYKEYAEMIGKNRLFRI